MEFKALLYCTKAKPYLVSYNNTNEHWYLLRENEIKPFPQLDIYNGKIVAECDFEVEEIIYNYLGNPFHDFYGMQLFTKTLKESEISQHSKLKFNELRKYLLRNEDDYISPLAVGYAIHIKNLHIFDKPRELDFYSSNFDYFKKVERAPQNMMRVWEDKENPRILISIRPEWICKILNGEKTIEVRKKVLKEMLKDEKSK